MVIQAIVIFCNIYDLHHYTTITHRDRASGSCPDIIMVGTHRDKASDCTESIEQKNEKLSEMFGPDLEDQV